MDFDDVVLVSLPYTILRVSKLRISTVVDVGKDVKIESSPNPSSKELLASSPRVSIRFSIKSISSSLDSFY